MSQSLVPVRGSQSREFWTKLVRRWETSSESQQAVADAAGVSVYTLRYWVAKLRADRSREISDFVEVVRPPTSDPQVGTVACRVRVGARVVLELDTLPSAEWVRALSEGS
jgi:hypothetical protein